MQITILNKTESSRFRLHLLGKEPYGLDWDGFNYVKIALYCNFFSFINKRPVTDFIKEFPELNSLYYQIVLIDDNPDLATISYY